MWKSEWKPRYLQETEMRVRRLATRLYRLQTSILLAIITDFMSWMLQTACSRLVPHCCLSRQYVMFKDSENIGLGFAEWQSCTHLTKLTKCPTWPSPRWPSSFSVNRSFITTLNVSLGCYWIDRWASSLLIAASMLRDFYALSRGKSLMRWELTLEPLSAAWEPNPMGNFIISKGWGSKLVLPVKVPSHWWPCRTSFAGTALRTNVREFEYRVLDSFFHWTVFFICSLVLPR